MLKDSRLKFPTSDKDPTASSTHRLFFRDDQWSLCADHAHAGPNNVGDHGGSYMSAISISLESEYIHTRRKNKCFITEP